MVAHRRYGHSIGGSRQKRRKMRDVANWWACAQVWACVQACRYWLVSGGDVVCRFTAVMVCTLRLSELRYRECSCIKCRIVRRLVVEDH